MELNKFNKYIKSFESNLFSADLTEEEYQEILKLILDKFLLLSKKEQLIFLLTKIPTSLEDIEAKNEQNVLNIELENKSEMIKIRSLAIRVFLIMFLLSFIVILGMAILAPSSTPIIDINGFFGNTFKMIDLLFK